VVAKSSYESKKVLRRKGRRTVVPPLFMETIAISVQPKTLLDWIKLHKQLLSPSLCL